MSTTGTPDFAGLLQRYRRRTGLTQEELAERAGLSRGSVSLLERGITLTPQKTTVSMLSEALCLLPDEAADLWAKARRAHHLGNDARHVTNKAVLNGNLPVPLTSLIGRDGEQIVLLEMLGRETTRLITLTGPAGVGKTRLALELAATVQRKRLRDVVFIGLIPVREPERVLATIAQAIGVFESDSRPLPELLVHTLYDQSVLLVLDNFEQVLPAARAVLELLIRCPQVKALVTSRSALNVRGEQRFPVPPLALPDPVQMNSLDALVCVPTVALFLDRARAVAPDFNLPTLEDGQLAASLCERLDGLPLAIELAAARVDHLGLGHLHDLLAEPGFLGVLTEGPQDLADHQRTIQSTITWSYELLGEAEQRLFRWLGVFIGGATPDALESVTGMLNDVLLPCLAALVNASLIQSTDVAGRRRYRQLVMLRGYAEERLHATGEWGEVRQRHAKYFLDLAERSFLDVGDNLESLRTRLEAEYDNIHAALTWAWETGATTHGLRMVGALRRVWASHAHFLESLGWLERFIVRAGTPVGPEDQAALAEAWTGVLSISHRLDRFERAREAGEAALALRRELGDKTQIAFALMNLANPLTELRDYDRAQALYQESLTMQREIGNRRGQILPLLNLGVLHYEMGKPQQALDCYEESIAISRAVGESNWARALTWNNIGEVYIVLNEPVRAIEVVEPVYRLFTREQEIFGAATSAFTLGRAAGHAGDVEASQAYLDEAERLFRNLGNLGTAARVLYFRAGLALSQQNVAACRRDLAQALDDLSGQTRECEDIWWLVERTGALALLESKLEQAASLYAAAMRHRAALSGFIEPAERELREHDLDRLRTLLGKATLESVLAASEVLSLDEARAVLRDILREHA